MNELGLSQGQVVLFFFLGIFAPDLRASERPMAIACFRFVTVFPDRPLLSRPRFISCMARSTLRLPLLLFAAMVVLTLPGLRLAILNGSVW